MPRASEVGHSREVRDLDHASLNKTKVATKQHEKRPLKSERASDKEASSRVMEEAPCTGQKRAPQARAGAPEPGGAGGATARGRGAARSAEGRGRGCLRRGGGEAGRCLRLPRRSPRTLKTPGRAAKTGIVVRT